MRNWKDNVSFVLVEPRESGNIGASARAIKNMGFRNLCLVNPAASVRGESKWFARHAGDVLESTRVCETLPEAIGGASLVVGTTRRRGRRRGVFMNVDAACRRLHMVAQHNRVAVLFGREDRGLFNDEVGECGFLLTIPASREQPSLNLSQAVMIVAYELRKAEHDAADEGDGGPAAREGIGMPEAAGQVSGQPSGVAGGAGVVLVNNAQLAALYTRMTEALRLLGYFPRGDRDLEKKMTANLKHLIGRAGLTDWELKMLHGICSRIEKKCSRTGVSRRSSAPI